MELCKRGFHACHELHKVWQFYPNNGKNVFYEVECGGKIIESKKGDGKFVCSEITLVKEVDMLDVDKFDDAWDFHEGFAAVTLDKKWNFIDTSGKLLSEQWYDLTCNFYKGLADVKFEGRWQKIDTNGKIIRLSFIQ